MKRVFGILLLCVFAVLPLTLASCDEPQPALPTEPSEGLEFTLREDGQGYILTGVTINPVA